MYVNMFQQTHVLQGICLPIRVACLYAQVVHQEYKLLWKVKTHECLRISRHINIVYARLAMDYLLLSKVYSYINRTCLPDLAVENELFLK